MSLSVIIPEIGANWHTDRYVYEDGKVRYLPLPEGRRVLVNDILIEPERDIRSVWEKLEHKTLKEKYAELGQPGYSRDNPVIHVKASGVYNWPITDPEFVPISAGGCFYRTEWPWLIRFYNPDLIGPWRSGLQAECGTDDVWCDLMWRTETLPKCKVDSITLYNREYNESAWRWRITTYTNDSGKYCTREDIKTFVDKFNHWDIEHTFGLKKYRVQSRPIESTEMIHLPAVSVDDDEIVRIMRNDMLTSLRYNELDLFNNSCKHGHFGAITPYEVKVWLGAAWNSALEYRPPSEDGPGNPGLPTCGFNNLMNIAQIMDGFSALAVRGAAQRSSALDKLCSIKGANEAEADRLISIGRKSRYRMTHDRQWWDLTPRQQKKILKDLEISSVTNTALEYCLPTKGLTEPLPDYFPSFGYDDLGQSWFQGRYVWSTGWHDASQAYHYFNSKMQQLMGAEEKLPVLHGSNRDSGVVTRVSFQVREKVLKSLAALDKALYTYGLYPTAEVVWDFIPYSFVADWFFPISPALAQFSRNQYYSPQYYEYVEGVCCSLKYESETARHIPTRCYTRWYQPEPPEADLGYTMLNSPKPSAKTAAFRFVDGCFLLIRR